MSESPTETEMNSTSGWDVIIVGAGPVGLLLANLLGANSVRTLVLEKKQQPSSTSRAIGIMPPSLEMLSSLGVEQKLVASGVRVTRTIVHGKHRTLGSLLLSRIGGTFPFVLTVPQQRTEELLRENLSHFSSVKLITGAEVTRVESSESRVTASYVKPDESGDGSAWGLVLVGCDGGQSGVRTSQNIPMAKGRYAPTFLMADFFDRLGLEDDAHLFFTPLGAVESFPLTEGHRRWIVQTDRLSEDRSVLLRHVSERTGHRLDGSDCVWESPFEVRWQLASSYCRGRVVLCGDSAHVMAPIGGQGMNTGFADAWMLHRVLIQTLERTDDLAPLLEIYSRVRRRAARVAMKRAALSMRVGTVTGSVGSAVRNSMITAALHSPLTKWLPRYFAMQTIPYGSAASIDSLFENHQFDKA